MVQLHILSGSRAGATWSLTQFPSIIGRARGVAVQLEEPGVWDQHLTLELDNEEGFIASIRQDAIASINGENFDRRKLRNGDVLELGAVKLQFWLADASQRGLRWRERMFAAGVALLFLIEAWLLWALAA